MNFLKNKKRLKERKEENKEGRDGAERKGGEVMGVGKQKGPFPHSRLICETHCQGRRTHVCKGKGTSPDATTSYEETHGQLWYCYCQTAAFGQRCSKTRISSVA